VGLSFKTPPLIDPNHLIDTITIEVTAVIRVNPDRVLRQHFTVPINVHHDLS
jgi:hypothetical protein